jgi:hypothetical protein
MIKLTAPDGSKVTIDGQLVLRARRTVHGEQREDGAQTRLDWVDMQLVKEGLETVVPAIKAELSTFAPVTSRDGSKIWINAKEATGPFPLTSSQDDGVVKSALKVMNYRQFVTETPGEIRALLKENGGTVLP